MSSSDPRGFAGIGYRAPLLSGEAGTAQTVKIMRGLVDQAVSDQRFIRQAIEIVRNVPQYQDLAEASAVYDYVSRHIRYTKDPVTKEKLYPPLELLKIRAGDCDDIAMLMGALMIALGYPSRLITISANADNPEEFSHVYLEAEVPPGSGMWIPMDAARPGAQFGIEPPMWYRKRAWSLSDDSYTDLSGCTCGESCSSCQVGAARQCGHLHGYTTVGGWGLGDAPNFIDPNITFGTGGSGINWGNILQQGIQEVPAIIATSSGQSAAIRNPYGTVQTGPYASFATPYTPGYGTPYAGYSSPMLGTQFTSVLPWIIGGGLLLAVLGGRGRS
jgi:hypothetical protein